MDPFKQYYLECIIHSLAREKFQIFGYIPDHEKLNNEYAKGGKLFNNYNLHTIGELAMYGNNTVRKMNICERGWNSIAYTDAIDFRHSEFKIKVSKTNSLDLSGIIVGLQKSTHLSAISLKDIKEHSIALNGFGKK